jgi:leucyl-tRNA synthetase
MDHKAVQQKWQKAWEDEKIFEVKESKTKNKFYVLEMYPYPSGSGLHMGHAKNYTLGDASARFKRMQGYNVLYPMGYDSFGLPAENAAIKDNTHPRAYTEKSIANFIRQQKELGLSYDWSRTLASHRPDYYRWDQWIFLELYKKGLAYKKTAIVNWCSTCQTVLANEQVVNGACWRHEDTPIDNKELNQWFIKITAYADQLLSGLEKLDWPEDIKQMQKNWIGKSNGVDIHFALEGIDTLLPAYTTRCDTIYSVTFLCIAPEHPLAIELSKGTSHEAEVRQAIEQSRKQSLIERTTETGQDKIGAFTGKYAINPVNGERLPIYVANFVLMYGTGIVMADAHDQRDFEFARKYNIPLKFVISDDGSPINPEKASCAFLSDGVLFDSGDWTGMHNRQALPEMAEWIEKNGWGKQTVNYKLRDWLISRQRYWGCPIPMVYCDSCGIVSVPEKELPVLLPEDVTFGSGNPLATNRNFVETSCPSCKKPARRETDTMDTFMDSSWYFLRYCDPHNDKKPFAKAKVDYWLPIDHYIGGKEHATGHLIYSRFITKFLKDLGMHSIDEPAKRLFNQGMLHKDGVVMSKSKGHYVLPEEVSEKYGIDTARFYLFFVAGPEKDMEWSDQGIEGAFRFMKKFTEFLPETFTSKTDPKEESVRNKTIRDVTSYYESSTFNKALIELASFTDFLRNKGSFSKKSAETLILLMSPITPHISEELWEKIGKKPFCSLAKWPTFDETKIKPELEAEDDFAEKVRQDMLTLNTLIKFKPKSHTLIISAAWKYDFYKKLKEELAKTRDMKTLITSCMVKGHESEIAPLVAAVLKDPSRLPDFILSQATEKKALNTLLPKLEKEFDSHITITFAEQSQDKKAANAMPGKVAIVAHE